MLHGRKRFITAVTGFTAVLAVALVPAGPSFADPDIDDVREKVDKLYHQAEQAAERYNDAKVERADLIKDLEVLHADADVQDDEVAALKAVVGEGLAAQYEGQTLPATGELAVSENPADFLDQLSTLDAYNSVRAEAMADYSRAREALAIREEAVAERTAELKALEKTLAKEKATADSKLEDAKELLDDLEAEEMEAYLAATSQGIVTNPPNVSASGRAGVAIKFAMAQVGDSYVYGAAGPSAWDCSGLMMRAWGAAGVGLPHSSAAQSGVGTRVSISALQPGDLVFYYSPISHVGMYIGGGQIVHAANPGAGVVVSGLHTMPVVGATRVG